MEIEYESILKVEETQVGNDTSATEDTVNCKCKMASGCSKHEIYRNDLNSKLTEMNSLKEKNKKLQERVKERDDYFYDMIKRNRKLKREKEDLDIKHSALKEETQLLRNKMNEVRQDYRDKEHSLSQQTNQMNQCRAEYSKINQKYSMLCFLRSQAESIIAENQTVSTSSSKGEKGATSPPSPSKRGYPQNSSNQQRPSSGNYPVNVQSSEPSTSNVIIQSRSHKKTKQALPQSNKIQCKVCMKSFSRMSALACHQRAHKMEKKRVGNEMEVNEDGPEPLPQDNFQCPECSRICLNACGLANHRRSHKREQQINDGLDEVHHSNQGIQQPLSQINPAQCPVCLKVCVSAFGLASHKKTHIKEQQKSNKASNLNETTHQSAPQANEFQCNECSRVCLNACGLANHRRSHTREPKKSAVNESNDQDENWESQSNKLQQSEVNAGKPGNRPNMKNRRQIMWSADGKRKKRYMCKEKHCNKIFYYPAQLREHENKHTGKKPYTCDICFKSFTYRASAYTHSLTHSAFKAHKCPKCQYSFTQQAHLKRHMLVHQRNNLKCHNCQLCDARFVSVVYLKQHMTRIHSQQTATAS